MASAVVADRQLPAPDRRPPQGLDDRFGDALVDVDQGERVIDADGTDGRAGDAGLVRDRADEVAGTKADLSSAADEQADPRTGTARPILARARSGCGRDPLSRPGARRVRGGQVGPPGDRSVPATGPSMAARRAPPRPRRSRPAPSTRLMAARAMSTRSNSSVSGSTTPRIAVEVVADQRLPQVAAQDLGPSLAQVRHRRQVGDLQLRVRGVLDVAQQAMLARLDERDGDALATGPSRPPDAVDVLRPGSDGTS